MKFAALFPVLVVVLASCSTTTEVRPPSPSAVEAPTGVFYTGPRFYDPLSDKSYDGVLVSAEGRILELWQRSDPFPNFAEQRELPGAFALPGLHDGHAHLEGIGMMSERIDLRNVTSLDEIRQRITTATNGRPGTNALYGTGWDQTLFMNGAFPTAQDLDGLSDLPIILSRVDGHAIWVNQAALDLVGITAQTKDMKGGEIFRDAKRIPTGILIDEAATGFQKSLDEKLGGPSRADRRRWLRYALRISSDVGLTSVHEMGMHPDAYDVLRELENEAKNDGRLLPVRVYVYLDGSHPRSLEILQNTPRQRAAANDAVVLQGMKIFLDGALGSRGAALHQSYRDRAGHRGQLFLTGDQLETQLKTVASTGHQAAVHAIGDRAITETLNAIAESNQAEQKANVKVHRPRIEHVQVIAPNDISRFKELGVIASMQPKHLTSDMRWAEDRIGVSRMENAYAFRKILDSDALLVFGSDAPVEPIDIRESLYAAQNRQDKNGYPEGGFKMNDALTAREIYIAFTNSAARAVGAEEIQGSLTTGRFFDLTVFELDPVEHADLTWLQNRATVTFVAGCSRRASDSAR